MLDRYTEEITFPRPLPLSHYRRVMVVAPHPDDEVYGCGGLMALACEAGAEVLALIVSDGAGEPPDSDATAVRRAESERAAARLGQRLAFMNLPDRQLHFGRELSGALAQQIDAFAPDLILCTALNEPHPDHQGVALAVMQALADGSRRADLAFYESGGALANATHVLDITAVATRKDAAMAEFISQEAVHPYASRIAGRDHYRALTLGPDCRAAEAFQLLRVADEGFGAMLPAMDPLFLHAREQAAHPDEAPLISVLVRTVGDIHLEKTLASILAQSHRPLEIVVVGAHGRPPLLHPPVQHTGIALRCVVGDGPLARAEAANTALDAARGEYCLLLDDDDLILPDHLEQLLVALRQAPQTLAAHSDTTVIRADDGTPLRSYAGPMNPQRQLAANQLPIHSVLFSRTLVTRHACRFDTQLPVLEDWDFWLQVMQHTAFAASQRATAIYRYADRSGLRCVSDGAGHGRHDHRHWRRQVLLKWLKRLPATHVTEALSAVAAELDELEQHHHHRCRSLESELQHQEALRIQAEKERVALLASLSWRVTAPLRHLRGILRARSTPS